MGSLTLQGTLKLQGTTPIKTSASKCPVTSKRPLAINASEYIDRPGIARANIAVSTEKPQGSEKYAERYSEYTVMQQHVLFWDRDGDNIITPWDTFIGFRELGFNFLFSFLAVLIINLNFSYPTRLGHSFIPDPLFCIYVDSIHKAKHGSDSGTYDNEGRFNPQAFENKFSKYDPTGTGSLSLRDLFQLMHGQRCAADPFGWGASFFEWGTTWLLIQRDGRVYKEDVRRIYDGSLFWKIREARMSKEGWNQGWGLGGDGMWGGAKVGRIKL